MTGKYRLLFALVVIMSCSVTANAQELRTYRPGMVMPVDYVQKDTLTIMAYNTENFTDAKDNPYISNRMEDDIKKDTSKEMMLAKVLRTANPDIVMIEEFETVAYLKEINQKYNLGYTYFGTAESPTWYQNTMLMSKVPIGTLRTYGAVYSPVVNEKDKEGKPMVQTNINSRIWMAELWPTPNQRIYLCGVHLKAGRNRADTATRTGQIDLIKGEFARLVKEDKNAMILMAGDLNATPESTEFQYLLSGTKRTRLVDPLAGTQVYSHPADNPRWRIDHILYNRNLASKVVPGTAGPVYVLSKPEMEKISDHLPVMIKILTR